MKRVLIVASSYAPAMPASIHRARMLAWGLSESGWSVEVLVPAKDFQRPEWLADDSAALFSPEVACHEAQPILTGLFRLFGMHGIDRRALLPVYRLGASLLAQRRFDLIYITTTSFNFFCLGRFWRRRFGVPYVLDFQDPWYRPRPVMITTKHWIKFRIGNKLSKYLEAFAVNGAIGLVSVSPNYLAELRGRYPLAQTFRGGNQAVIPFGVLPLDLEVACKRTGQRPANDRLRNIVYVGVGDIVMQKSFRRLIAGLARLRHRHPDLIGLCRLCLAGTHGGWKPGDPKVLFDEAVAVGLGNLVTEDPQILSYPVATSLAVAADGLLVLGVDDPGYMPSKLFPYAMTGKPLLACLHWQSQANEYFERFPELGTLIHFAAPCEVESNEDSRLLTFLRQVVSRQEIDRARILAVHSAEAMARQHAELFERCLKTLHRSNLF